MQKEIEKLKNENAELENLMELTEDPQIKTFCDETRQYSKIVREVMSLISYNVALKQIPNVIRTVVKKFADKNIAQLPRQQCQGWHWRFDT